jgi:hypothetical protein
MLGRHVNGEVRRSAARVRPRNGRQPEVSFGSHSCQTDCEPLDNKALNTLQRQELELGSQAELKQARDREEPDAQDHHGSS